MGTKRAIEEERAALKRLVALLLALADLALFAGSRSPVVRGFVLWLLRHAEMVAWDFIACEPDTTFAPMPVGLAGEAEAEALRLAISFQVLACELDRQAGQLLADWRDGRGATEPPFANRLALCDGFHVVLVFVASFGRARQLPAAPDTS